MAARYTLIAGTRNWSSWSLRPFIALTATGVPFETVTIRLRQPGSKDAILAHSPSGKVPLLKIEENGRTLAVWDSLAICEAVAERHPEAGLWPADADVRAIARSHACEMHSGFADLRDQLTMECARTLPLPDLREDTKAQIARVIAAWQGALADHTLAGHTLARQGGGGFLFGRLSIADCMYAPVVSRFETYGVAVPPPVRAYMDRVLALPAMREWRRHAEEEVAAGIA